jgi:PKD repeat protein
VFKFSSCVSILVLVSVASFAGTRFHPTTTLTVETSNNTSGADQFAGQANGNIAPGNVSKVPLQTLLYPGSAAKIYAHLVPWFGFGDHVEVGYTSSDVQQIQKQVADMISRGIDGVIIDWYGRGEFHRNFVEYDQGVQSLMLEAEKHTGFTFALMEDVGALKACAAGKCNPTDALIEDLNYAQRTYQGSPAYMQYNGRPVVFFFGVEAYNIDWHRVRSRVAGNPVFIFRNAGAFNHVDSDGGYAWVEPRAREDKGNGEQHKNKADDSSLNLPDMGYLDGYYFSATHHPDDLALGAGYKGFDDSIALWSRNRFIDQQCGRAWLASIAEAGKYYSETTQMSGIQLVTWNDYEEGSEFETGVDNCVTITAGAHGSKIRWKVEGDETTLDHYTIFVSQDGENLMPLADVDTGQHSLDLGRFGLDPADYTVFVKAIGKPSLTNKMSRGTRMMIAPGQSNTNGAEFALSVTPDTAVASSQITASISGLDSSSIAASVIDFGDGTIASGQLASTHVYRLAGSYTIIATVTANNGASTTRTTSITINEHP